jgi:hypothetical protein
MKRINNRAAAGAVVIICLLLALPAPYASAGGPVCRVTQCMPPMCAPPMMFCGPTVCAPPMPCPPPLCAAPMPCPPPVCAAPMPCPPPVCKVPRPCPPPVCGPPPCGPKPCKENPLARMFRGACDLVVGAVSLPFAAVDCIVESCGPSGGPCNVSACPPPACMPPMCGPGYGPAYGMGPGRRPMGIGRHAPRKMVPFAKGKSERAQLFAGPPLGIFGNYW